MRFRRPDTRSGLGTTMEGAVRPWGRVVGAGARQSERAPPLRRFSGALRPAEDV